MTTSTASALRAVALCAASLALASTCFAQSTDTAPAAPTATEKKVDNAMREEGNWYASWGYSRQQYAPSDIHVSQPGLGNDFTVRQVAASDFPATVEHSLRSLTQLNWTDPQENVRVGRFMNPEKTFAIELSLDHSKYNTNGNQVAQVTGVINGQPVNTPMVLDAQTFDYALHNGLNHIMINAVWLHHLAGPEQKTGHLQAISRVGAGILLPHAENTILGRTSQVGPKSEKICCTGRDDWWQINGWTAGVEVGLRYRVYKSLYMELTQKLAYGVLNRVPVYQGSADQTIWMSEQVLSVGYLF
jgi:hypothetical protein